MLKDFFNRKKYAVLTFEEDKKDKEDKKTQGPVETKIEKEKINTSYDKIKDSRINPRKRIENIMDKDTFLEYDLDLQTSNPLEFPEYNKKIETAINSSNENEAVITGEGDINGDRVIICVMNPSFMMGSMGSVVGEKITRAMEMAIEKRLPIIVFAASGGARMQEGIISLMQMAKTSAAVARLNDEGILYISVLTDPTTGGVTASFAMLGDIILAEPGALIGFAGPRVIEQTIKQKLPEGFQRAEFLLEKGFIDRIVKREDMKYELSQIIKLHSIGGGNYE